MIGRPSRLGRNRSARPRGAFGGASQRRRQAQGEGQGQNYGQDESTCRRAQSPCGAFPVMHGCFPFPTDEAFLCGSAASPSGQSMAPLARALRACQRPSPLARGASAKGASRARAPSPASCRAGSRSPRQAATAGTSLERTFWHTGSVLIKRGSGDDALEGGESPAQRGARKGKPLRIIARRQPASPARSDVAPRCRPRATAAHARIRFLCSRPSSRGRRTARAAEGAGRTSRSMRIRRSGQPYQRPWTVKTTLASGRLVTSPTRLVRGSWISIW